MTIVTLTTDFGLADGYVGTMKGVILSIAPSAHLVDVSHDIAPQHVRQAAYVLSRAPTSRARCIWRWLTGVGSGGPAGADVRCLFRKPTTALHVGTGAPSAGYELTGANLAPG